MSSVASMMALTGSLSGEATMLVEALVVGGGGSGTGFTQGVYFGGGGNGGNVTVATGFAVTLGTALSVEVGAGGGAIAPSYSNGAAGTRSLFSTLVASGAGSQPHPSNAGITGGPNGGANTSLLSSPLITLTSVGATTTTTTYSGQGSGYTQYCTVVGGGAGGYAQSYTGGAGRRAGPGYLWAVNNTRYAGGGGSGGANNDPRYYYYLGGLGGGGNGAPSVNNHGSSGTANRGGGGGGAHGTTHNSGAGGSGVVLIWVPQTSYTNYTTSGLAVSRNNSFTNAATNTAGTLLTVTSGNGTITFN